MSDDEFDNVPGDLANIQGIDWDDILGNATPLPSSTAPLPHQSPTAGSYYSGDDDMDAAFLAELDVLEHNITQGSVASTSALPSTLHQRPVRVSRFFSGASDPSIAPVASRDAVPGPRPAVQLDVAKTLGEGPAQLARKRPRSPSPLVDVDRKGKRKATDDEGVRQVLETYEDEMTCPICCDIFVATHLGNPCGHSFCGDCGWQWIIKNKNGTCAVCRAVLTESMPMIPNIAMDNMVAKHIEAMGVTCGEGWKPGGRKHREWNGRLERWKQDVGGRGSRCKRARSRRRAVVEVIDMVSLDGALGGWFVDGEWEHRRL